MPAHRSESICVLDIRKKAGAMAKTLVPVGKRASSDDGPARAGRHGRVRGRPLHSHPSQNMAAPGACAPDFQPLCPPGILRCACGWLSRSGFPSLFFPCAGAAGEKYAGLLSVQLDWDRLRALLSSMEARLEGAASKESLNAVRATTPRAPYLPAREG